MKSNNAEMETDVITTSSTGVVTTMLSLHRKSQGTSPDSLRTVSGGLSTTAALVTLDLVDSCGRDEAAINSSRVVVEVSKGRVMVVISSGRDLLVINSGTNMAVISSCREMVELSSGREMVAISSGRDVVVISSGRDVVLISSSEVVSSSNRNMVIISGRDNRARGRAAGVAPGTSPLPGAGMFTTVYREDSVY